MFFYFPIGHDQPFYERPVLTLSLIAACTLALVATTVMEVRATDVLGAALLELEAVRWEHPDARVSLEVSGLPEMIEPSIAPLIDTSPERAPAEGDAELEAALRRTLSALNRLPALALGFQPGRPDVGRAFTHMFVHAGVFHLLGNMLLLWVAGGVLECFWRRWAYLLLYFGSGLAGLLAHALADPHGLTPIVGASGAVSGLMGAFLVSYPRTKIRIVYAGWLFRPFFGQTERAAWVVLPLWAGVELASALLQPGSDVAHWAHVGGFACGAVAALIAKRMHWIAEDAGISRVAKIVDEPMPERAPRTAAASIDLDALPLPEATPAPIAAPVAPPRAPSGRPPLEAIELSSLPAHQDETDPFER